MSDYNVLVLRDYNVFLLSRRDQDETVFIFAGQLDKITQGSRTVIQPPQAFIDLTHAVPFLTQKPDHMVLGNRC